jgi:hypothetical protein
MIPASKWPWAYALNCMATGIGKDYIAHLNLCNQIVEQHQLAKHVLLVMSFICMRLDNQLPQHPFMIPHKLSPFHSKHLQH